MGACRMRIRLKRDKEGSGRLVSYIPSGLRMRFLKAMEVYGFDSESSFVQFIIASWLEERGFMEPPKPLFGGER